jgi:hypothetical protein
MSTRLYSQTTGSTYLTDRHSEIPPDAKPISEQRYREVIANPAPGKVRSHDADGLPILVDPEAPSREVQEQQAWEGIKTERDRRTQLGGFQVEGHWFHSDTFSRSQQLGLVMLGDTLPTVQWKTMSGAFVSMTPALAQAIFTAGVASDMAVFAAAEAHRVAMQASADPLAYDFAEGWPPVYVPEEA